MTASHHGPPLAAPSPEAALGALRAHGLRASTARRLVLEALFAADEPVTAERIAGGVGGRFPRSDLASVYRNLETLEELGLVQHLHFGHGPSLYAPAGRSREYVLCESCGSVRSVEPERLRAVRELIRRELGLAASFSHFPIVGVCDACAGHGRREAA
jgi:Fur family transcriptional regulator, ferric uptake regulator